MVLSFWTNYDDLESAISCEHPTNIDQLQIFSSLVSHQSFNLVEHMHTKLDNVIIIIKRRKYYKN